MVSVPMEPGWPSSTMSPGLPPVEFWIGPPAGLCGTVPLRTAAEQVAWSRDGATLAVMGDDSRIDLWDPATIIWRGVLEGHYKAGLNASFHPDGTLLASRGNDGRLRLWDTILARTVLEMGAAGRLHMSEDGRIVVEEGDQMTTFRVEPALEIQITVLL